MSLDRLGEPRRREGSCHAELGVHSSGIVARKVADHLVASGGQRDGDPTRRTRGDPLAATLRARVRCFAETAGLVDLGVRPDGPGADNLIGRQRQDDEFVVDAPEWSVSQIPARP